MSGGAYRDANEGARERSRELEAGIASREGEVPERFRPFLPKDVREDLESAHLEMQALGEDSGAAASRVPILERYKRALDAAFAHVAVAEARYRELPSECPEPPEFPFSIYADARGARKRCESIVHALDPAARFQHEPTEIRAWFEWCEVPYALRYRWRATVQPDFREDLVALARASADGSTPIEGDFILASSASRDAGPLSLSPEHMRHGIGKALGLVREIEVGDLDLDSAFLIRGDAHLARAMLRGALRYQLAAFCRFDVPTLEVGPGRVSLSWHYETHANLLRRAAGILALARGV